jgi:hypothetical protein
VISVQAIVTSIELRNPTESQPIEITQFIFQSASKSVALSGRSFAMRPNMRRPAKAASPKAACLIETDPLPKLG